MDSTTEHLRTMPHIVYDLNSINNNLINEQQVTIVICSSLESWMQMKFMLMYNKNIKTFTDSYHILLGTGHFGYNTLHLHSCSSITR